MAKAANREPGKELRQAREARGLSLQQMSEIANVSTSTISQIERGLRSPRSEAKLRAVFAALSKGGRA